MLEADRRLLARLRALCASAGEIALSITPNQESGDLQSGPLRDLGHLLTDLGLDLTIRANALDAVVEAPNGRHAQGRYQSTGDTQPRNTQCERPGRSTARAGQDRTNGSSAS
jgi:hypothetical protein